MQLSDIDFYVVGETGLKQTLMGTIGNKFGSFVEL